MDYGHSLEFGYFLIPDAGDPRGVLETARLADRLGYDLLAVQDHPYLPPAAAGESQTAIDHAAREAARDTDDAIVGPPDHWTDVLTHLALDLGFDTFVLMGRGDPRMLRSFIEDVAPGVRERVASARAVAGVR